MATKTKVSAKELRREAKSLGVKGWEEMDADELQAAIDSKSDNGSTSRIEKAMKSAGRNKVKKSKATKENEATSKAVKAKKAATEHEVAENGNPFRPGTNLFLITEELIKGGKRSKMVARLSKKIELKPRKNSKDFDETAELDRRVLITAQLLEKDHGFSKEKDGRGPDATIKVTAP